MSGRIYMDEKVLFNSILPRLEELNPEVAGFIDSHGGDLLRTRLETVYTMLEEENGRMNLTALHGESSVLLHLFDSLMLARTAETLLEGRKRRKVCDVGCGGGFPSLPLAAALPDVELTSVDSTAKKLGFVARCAEACASGADGKKPPLVTLPARAEELPEKGYGNAFDIVTARAVAKLNVLSELCLPLTAVGGWFLPMKTDETELCGAENALKKLGGECVDTVRYSLRSENEVFSRVIFVIKKTFDAKGYPRKYAKIVKSPL